MTIASNSDAEVLIFLHIPKTAGSTLHTILNRRYRGIKNIFASSIEDDEVLALRKLGEKQRNDIDLLKGHMPFGLHQFLPRQARYFTMLRDPVERVISQYFYIRNNKNNPLHETLVSKNMSPAQLVESGISVGLNNGQIRWLLGDLQAIEFCGIDETHLQMAKDNIENHFIAVGINEMFDESILVLANRLCWKRPPYYDRMNTNRSKTLVSDEDIAAIRKYNEYDIKLYDYAVEKLKAEIEASPGFTGGLEKFRSRNNLYSVLNKPFRLFRN